MLAEKNKYKVEKYVITILTISVLKFYFEFY